MLVNEIVLQKIAAYKPEGNLDHTARLILTLSSVNHNLVKGHLERVGLLAERVAETTDKDPRASFFAGLLHDIGKLVLPADLFDGHNISPEEYARVKTHAISGFTALKDHHLFTALCAGLHHAVYTAGYGLTIDDFPRDWNLATIKKVLEISTIVSVCDFIDAFTHRQTTIRDGSDDKSPQLSDMLYHKYPHDRHMINVALFISDREPLFQ